MKQKVTRFALTLLVMMLTTATAWADNPSWLKSGDSWDETTKTLTVNTETVAENAYRIRSEIEHVIISDNVTVMYSYAFKDCTNLKSVFLGSGVSELYSYTFDGCTSLKSVVITKSSSVLHFASDALPNHDGLKIYVPKVNGNILAGYTGGQWASYYGSGKIVGYDWTSGTCALALNNDGVMSVGGIAMADTNTGSRGWKNSIGNITSVVIEDGVTHIGDNAFYGCGGLTSVSIPASVMSIGDNAFYLCGSLASITVADGNQTFDSRDNCNAIIRKADNTLILGCKTTVIPNSVTSIGHQAFFGCGGLTAISIPDGVQSIGDGAFGACSNLESVNIGSGVSSIAISAFNNCDKLATITVADGNQTFDSREGCNAIIHKADNTLVAGCKTTVIPNSVTNIGDMAFWGNGGLTSITIPASVTSIGFSAFYSCSNLASVTLNGVATIGESAFYTGTTVTIAEGLILYNGTELLSGAITDRSKLNGKTLLRCYSITLPDHVTASGTAGVLNNIIYALPDATVTISAATGYIISNIAVNGSPIEGNSFTMPGADVTITVTLKKLMTNEDITITIPSQDRTGIELTPVITVKDGETTLTLNEDYTVTAPSGPIQDAGNYTYIINGMGNYAGSKEAKFTIVYPTVTTSYVDASGTLHENVIAIPLDNTMTTLAAGWYVVNSNVNYTGQITLGDDVNIILADGKTMTASGNTHAIYGDGPLTIYGQALGTGILTVTSTNDVGIRVVDGVTINGGTVNANGIYADGDITINGGKVTSTGDPGIYSNSDNNGTIILGLRNATDYITAESYIGTVKVADGKTLHNGNEVLSSGTVTDNNKVNEKVLTAPTYGVTANRATTQDTEYWSTFYHPVASYQVGADEKAYIGKINGNTVTLTEITDGIIPANTAVVLKATTDNFDLTRTATSSSFSFTANELKGGSTVADGKVVYTLAAKNGVVGFYKFAGTLNPNKAHLEITPPPAQSAPAFFGFGGSGENTTAINEHESHQSHEFTGDYYTLDGRKLQGKPTQKGIYVRNGRKIIIK